MWVLTSLLVPSDPNTPTEDIMTVLCSWRSTAHPVPDRDYADTWSQFRSNTWVRDPVLSTVGGTGKQGIKSEHRKNPEENTKYPEPPRLPSFPGKSGLPSLGRSGRAASLPPRAHAASLPCGSTGACSGGCRRGRAYP